MGLIHLPSSKHLPKCSEPCEDKARGTLAPRPRRSPGARLVSLPSVDTKVIRSNASTVHPTFRFLQVESEEMQISLAEI